MALKCMHFYGEEFLIKISEDVFLFCLHLIN